jgi:hypothetical protein
MKDEARSILSRVMMIRDDMDASRLTRAQIRLYNELGKRVEIVTKDMEVAADNQAADALWRWGAEYIHDFLAEHFPCPTKH